VVAVGVLLFASDLWLQSLISKQDSQLHTARALIVSLRRANAQLTVSQEAACKATTAAREDSNMHIRKPLRQVLILAASLETKAIPKIRNPDDKDHAKQLAATFSEMASEVVDIPVGCKALP
jgi:hypothetical protein